MLKIKNVNELKNKAAEIITDIKSSVDMPCVGKG
jgi:hypothetical protein